MRLRVLRFLFSAVAGVLPATTLTAQSFVYVANSGSINVSGSSSVSAYTINPVNGVLTTVPGSPFAAGRAAFAVTVDPSGRFAYVTNNSSSTVSAYTIDPATGALAALPGSPFAAGNDPRNVAVDPTGKFAYVTNYFSSKVFGYTINQANGTLTAMPGSPFVLGTNPNAVTVDPTGQFAYVTMGGGGISAYTINSATGALTAVSGSPAGGEPVSVTVDPTGQFVYVANFSSSNVSAYTTEPATGALTPISGSPFAAGTSPNLVTIDPTGQFVYVANQNSTIVSAYTIDPASGALTAIPGSPFTAETSPNAVTVDPTGHFAYVANSGGVPDKGSVSAYTINPATGALTAVPGSPFAAGSFPNSVVSTSVNGPVLRIVDFHTGNFTRGQTGITYTLTVSNFGLGATSGTVAVTEKVPVGMTLVSMAGSGWTCKAGGVICARSDSLAAGTSYPTITVTANVASNAPASVVNEVFVSGRGLTTASDLITILGATSLPTIAAVVNAANFQSGPISPGEMVTLFGVAIGPTTPAYATIDSSTGKLATTIGGVQVLFNGIAAPMIYVSSTQVSAVVPYEMASAASPGVSIKYAGQTSNAYQLTTMVTAPGLFTQNSSGSGPGCILNQDYSSNGPNNPAAKGSVVMVYLTGEGQTNPPSITGAITTATLPPPQVTPAPVSLPISVLINGQPAPYVYAGEAPGFVAGLMQLNAQIPPNAPSGALSIQISIGGNSSQNGVTISVQ